jgi:hypothetical protein
MNAWEIHTCDLGWGPHPVVIPIRRELDAKSLEVLDCSSQRASRPPFDNEVLLDESDGLDWPTLCKCDCIFAVPRHELKDLRGVVSLERRRKIVRTIIQTHGWNML